MAYKAFCYKHVFQLGKLSMNDPQCPEDAKNAIAEDEIRNQSPRDPDQASEADGGIGRESPTIMPS